MPGSRLADGGSLIPAIIVPAALIREVRYRYETCQVRGAWARLTSDRNEIQRHCATSAKRRFLSFDAFCLTT